MKLTPEQLTQVFNEYLRSYVLARSPYHHPTFDSIAGGLALTKRLQKILRDPEVSYIYSGSSIDCEELIRVAKEKLKDRELYIVGLDYWFNADDMDRMRTIYCKLFLD